MEVETIIRLARPYLAERGIECSQAKLSRLTRRYLRHGGSSSNWLSGLTDNERQIAREIESAANFVSTIHIVSGGLPGMGKR